MYDHLAEDLKKVEYRKEYYLPKAIKEFRKAKVFPVWKWYEYKVPNTNNKYVIYYYSENANSIEKPQVGFFVDVFWDKQRYLIRWGASPYRHTPRSSFILLRQLHVYTSHFLHRYNERFLKDESLSSNDIACRYLSRNEIATPIDINKEINAHIDDYGENAKWGYHVHDGFCFTRTCLEGEFHEDNREKDRVDAMVIVYTTFITEAEMSDRQVLAIEKEHRINWTDSFIGLIKEAEDGVVTLTLEP